MASIHHVRDPHGREPATGRPVPGAPLQTLPAEPPPVRLPGIDLPEARYPGHLRPSTFDLPFARLARWIAHSPDLIEDQLAAHLVPRLATGRAGSLQEWHGLTAVQVLHRLLEPYRLPPGHDAVEALPALLPEELATVATLLVDSGWAVPFPVYPELREEDLRSLQEAAREARRHRRGAWADPEMLTGYEFRMCVRLLEAARRLKEGERLGPLWQWIDLYCANLTTRRLYRPQQYCLVAPCKRIFIRPPEVLEATARLHLVGG